MYRYAMINGEEIIQVLDTPLLHIECPADVDDAGFFYNAANNTIEGKGALDTTHSINGLEVTFVGLPSGVSVETDSFVIQTDADPLIVEYDVPGTYTINFSGHVKYLDHTMEVTVG